MGVPGDRLRGDLPLAMTLWLDDDQEVYLSVRQLRARGQGFRGAYCVRLEGSSDATIKPVGDVEVEWVALAADRGSVFPPFLPVAAGDWAGAIQPLFPLVGDRYYAVVVTKRVRDHDGLRSRRTSRSDAPGRKPRSRAAVALLP
jgi:hypothetical protein